MDERISRDRVKGFLTAQGNKILNEDGDEVLLTGWGVGNWLLPEGYMWKIFSQRFDRPRRMEQVLEELTGSTYARDFWERFRQSYVTEKDIEAMAAWGYNSVRVPFNARLFLEEGEGLQWKEEGFLLLDRCIEWCEKHRLYVFLDMHGAPGGQTGANIDDCIDDIPRLFIDDECFNKAIALWGKLAERYADRSMVGGYDLLNEPIRPHSASDLQDYDRLLPRLAAFYDKAVAAVREFDQRHLISIEGHHWATNTEVFYKKYDPQMILHFHRYACYPQPQAYEEFLETGKRLDCPLWLGETGENKLEWYSAMFPLSLCLGIGYNLWTWKKMECTNSPCSVRSPEDWKCIAEYVNQGRHPGHEKARKIFDRYLENIKFENNDHLGDVHNYVFRKTGSSVRATDFDYDPKKGSACSGTRKEENLFNYRKGSGMKITEQTEPGKREFAFDSQWDRFGLELCENEFACYTFSELMEGCMLELEYNCKEAAELLVYQDDCLKAQTLISRTAGGDDVSEKINRIYLKSSGQSVLKVSVKRGHLCLLRIRILPQLERS